jgi:hypothetical protein
MRSIEFKSTISRDGQITIPPDVAHQIPQGETLQVVVLWEQSDVDADWRVAGLRRFEAAYAPEDSVYEQLVDDSPPR